MADPRGGGSLAEQHLVYDWNTRKKRHPLSAKPILLMDETLRDGLQGPSIVDPSLEDKKRIVELADSLGIHYLNLGLPGAGPRARAHVEALAVHIRDKGLKIKPCAAGRTHHNDIQPIIDISKETGIAIEVMAFVGTSPIRQFVEGWDLKRLLEFSTPALAIAVKAGLPVTYVTEDTVRSHPATLDRLWRNAIDLGVQRFCLCDTVGHATPDGVRDLIDFARNVIEASGAEVGLDYHGHNDRGLALTNSLRALEYGCDRVHGTALGIGERVGNASLDQILVNLKLLGEIDNDLSDLAIWCHSVSQATRWEIPLNYPIMGHDAFRTATGVHAAAVIKAKHKGDAWLADRVYSGIPAAMLGRKQLIEIGPMSGLSNVRYWLEERGVEAAPGLAESVLAQAKASDRLLSEPEVEHLVRSYQPPS
jgi:2-isopropylmalate synthase